MDPLNCNQMEPWLSSKGFGPCLPGDGCWPRSDYKGRPFSESDPPQWREWAGRRLTPSGWRAVLDGFQGDADFFHKTFRFKRNLAVFQDLKQVPLMQHRPHSLQNTFWAKAVGTVPEKTYAHTVQQRNTWMMVSPEAYCIPILGRMQYIGQRPLTVQPVGCILLEPKCVIY